MFLINGQRDRLTNDRSIDLNRYGFLQIMLDHNYKHQFYITACPKPCPRSHQLQVRMQCQIRRLNENFEQAQLRILGLQTQVQTLRRTVSSTGDGEGDNDIQECACKSFFDNP